jgi:hypothetical protein
LRKKCFLKHVTEGMVEGKRSDEEGVNSYWMTLRKEKTLEF